MSEDFEGVMEDVEPEKDRDGSGESEGVPLPGLFSSTCTV